MANQKRTHLLVALGALGALLAPATAFATINPVGQTAWTLWAFGNGNVIYNLLYSAKGLVSSGGYMELVGFLSLIAIVTASVVASTNALASKKLMATILGVWAFIAIGLQETANVVVNDPVTGYINVVPGVPALVAIPPAVISEAGYKLTQLLEQYYTLPNDLTLSGGGGFDLANSLVNDETQVQVTSPYLRATVAAFTQNCIMPALASGRLSAAALVDSTALWTMNGQTGTLSQAEQSSFTPVYTGNSPGGTVIPCGPGGVGKPANGATSPTVTSSQYPSVTANNAYQYISDYFNTASPDWLANTASTFANTSTYSWLGTELASAEQWDFGTSLTQSTGETISQAAAVNLMKPAMRAAAVASGDSPLVTSLAVSQGQQSQVSSWATSAALFRDLAGYIFSVLQAFILGIAPIILAVVVIPGAGKRILLSYGQVLIWLALWDPTMSIINYIVALYAQGQLGPTLGSSGGFSMMNQSVITQMTSNMELAAGFLASTVPLITWGLVKGGLAFTDFVVGAVGSSFATTAGAMAATGNVSMGNFSMGNTTLDQQMLAARTTTGAGQSVTDLPGEGIIRKDNSGGNVRYTAYGEDKVAWTGVTAQQAALNQTASHTFSTSAARDTSQAMSDASSAMASIMQSGTIGHGTQTGISTGQGASISRGGTTRVASSITAGLSHIANDKEAKEFGYGLGLKLGAGQKQALTGEMTSEAKTNPALGSKIAAFLGGLNMSASMDAGTKADDSVGTSASMDNRSTQDVAGSMSGDLKTSGNMTDAVTATLNSLANDQTGYSNEAKTSIAGGLKSASSAANDWKLSRSFAKHSAFSEMSTVYGSAANINSPQNFLATVEGSVRGGRKDVGSDVQGHLKQGAALTNKANTMTKDINPRLAAATERTPSGGAVRTKAEDGVRAATTGASEADKHTAQAAAGTFKTAGGVVNTDNGAANSDFGSTASGVHKHQGVVTGAVANHHDPFDVVTPRGTGGMTDLAGGGILSLGEAGVAGALKNLAVKGLMPKGESPGPDGGGGGISETEPEVSSDGVPTIPSDGAGAGPAAAEDATNVVKTDAAESLVSDIESDAEAIPQVVAEVGG